MKKLLTLAAFAALLLAGACQKEEKPAVDFAEKIVSVYSQGSTDIVLRLSKAAESQISVPVSFGGSAVKGTDYSVSAEEFVFKAGQTESYITFTDIDLDESKSVTLKLVAGGAYTIGNIFSLVVNLDVAEQLIYNFNVTKADLYEKLNLSVSVSGVHSGAAYKAPAELSLPITVGGDGSQYISCSAQNFVIAKGSNSASVEITLSSAPANDLESDPVAVIGIEGGDRFIPGDNGTCKVRMKSGLQVPSHLCGTWNFSKVFDLDELELWFLEMEDDPDELPTHNEGFTLTFTENEDGSVTLTPSGKGDLLNYFRECTVTLTTPMNYSTEGTILGKYTVSEMNMFQAEEPDDESDAPVFTYYKLSRANRAFSASSEKLGESVIAFRINNKGNLEMQLRDYDCPPFGMMWWDDNKFDADMFSFASLFTPAE